MTPIRGNPAPTRVHILSCVDSTDPEVDRAASGTVQSWEELRALTGDTVLIDTVIDRAPTVAPRHPALRRAAGVGIGLLPAALGAGLALGTGLQVLGLAAGAAGAVASSFLLGSRALRDFMSPPPHWSGQRVYRDVVADHSREIDTAVALQTPWSGARDTRGVIAFLAEHAPRYPSSLRLVHLEGHGTGFRLSAGLRPTQFEGALKAASADRPVDLLLMESCLQANLETLLGIYPYARYAVVTADTVTRRSVEPVLSDALRQVAGKAFTAEDLGKAIVQAAGVEVSDALTGETSARIRSLSLVRLDGVPALAGAVDRLGDLLAREVAEGREIPIREALRRTVRYPLEHRAWREALNLGDLSQFAAWIEALYAQSARPDSTGPESPRRAEIARTAGQVMDLVRDCVPARRAAFKGPGGISVQLPGAGFLAHEAERNRPRFFDSAAPEGWKRFVRSLAPVSVMA